MVNYFIFCYLFIIIYMKFVLSCIKIKSFEILSYMRLSCMRYASSSLKFRKEIFVLETSFAKKKIKISKMFGENALDGSCLKFTGRFELFLFESLSRPLSSSMSLQRASLCPTPPHLKPLSILYQLVKTLQKIPLRI